jgi:hypothetical protein
MATTAQPSVISMDDSTRMTVDNQPEQHGKDSSGKSEAGPPNSTLSSINAQLISHGWTKRPLNLERLSEKDQQAVTAVLFDLLGSSVVSVLSMHGVVCLLVSPISPTLTILQHDTGR